MPATEVDNRQPHHTEIDAVVLVFARIVGAAVSNLVEHSRHQSRHFSSTISGYSTHASFPNLTSSRCNLWVLVNFTTETQRTQRLHRESLAIRSTKELPLSPYLD